MGFVRFSSPLQYEFASTKFDLLSMLTQKNPLADKGGKVMFLGRESSGVTGKITSFKLNARKNVLL